MENTTAPTSLPTELSSESLTILNVVEGRIQKMLKSRVCELEQESLDVQKLELHDLAQSYRDEARTTDLLRHRVSREVTQLFLEVLQSLNTTSPSTTTSTPTISTTRSPELPSLPRRPYGSGAVVEVSAVCSEVQSA